MSPLILAAALAAAPVSGTPAPPANPPAAAPQPASADDLGLGLVYRRAHAIPADLPTDETLGRRACVFDIRFVHGDAAAARALAAWVQFHASRSHPVLLLANARTSPELLAPFRAPTAVPGLIILGPASARFDPDIPVRVSAERDRRAYDAVERGGTLESVLKDPREKPRNDEAMLDREHLPDSAAADPPEGKDEPAPLIDRVLQRAVQLHRTLLALKRI